MNDAILNNHKAAAPAVPEPEALQRVHDAARRIARSRAGARPRWQTWRMAVSVAAAAAIIGAVVWVTTPHFDDSAFAQQAAAAALLPTDGVLHTKGSFTVKGTNTNWDFALEDWTDAGQKSSRTENRSPEDGALEELSVRVGGTVRALAHDKQSNKWTKWGYDAPEELGAPGGDYVDLLRKGLESGEAQVVDRIAEENQHYWVVEREISQKDQAGAGTLTEQVRAIMAVDDYALRELVVRRSGDHPVDGKWTETVTLKFSVWEVIPRSSLPEGFLTLKAVDEAAPAGTVEQR